MHPFETKTRFDQKARFHQKIWRSNAFYAV